MDHSFMHEIWNCLRAEDEEEGESKRKGSSRVTDLVELSLLRSRIVFLHSGVDQDSAREVIHRVWHLEISSPGKPILFVINSPGGSVTAGLAIWDQMQLISSPITTLVTGLAASMGSMLSLVAPRGSRWATPQAKIMIHQPAIWGTVTGQATDLEIQAREIRKTKETMIDLYMTATKQSREVIEKSLDRDTWMTAQEAKAFGLIDQIVSDHLPLQPFFKSQN
ncbi:ATP-dependent Clp protease proteolytic subunit [Candidatus Similichlamydia laticola]|uniref:ATP-dependent Clp protease proteolytic subunit n=2 Tax=Candidatus Similichlamydia laticola TaxID=2170265 RepID=A0A369KD10_9BACT|nr:ATP-dependent Clp protease proteolytic subunit [Candidatus Similichlamydia laticola]